MGEKQKIVTICPYCGLGCGLYVVVEDSKATGIDYLYQHPLTQGALCPKGNAILDIVYHRERLANPLRRQNEDRTKIGWEEAVSFASNELKRIRDAHGADAIGFISSAKCTNEENYLFARLARLMGTNNVDNCARLCHSPTLTGLISGFGSGSTTNPITDLVNSCCILIIGSNLAENHPVASRWA